MFPYTRDIIPVPTDEAASWIFESNVDMKIDVFLLTLVAYDAGISLFLQESQAPMALTVISVITFDKEVPPRPSLLFKTSITV